jgi:methylmalonyl-CoA/ethylmalonyl-CoA epimerase
MSPPLGLSTLGQLSINVQDLPRATTFYRDALGIPFLFEVPKMAFFDLDGVRLMLASPEGPGTEQAGSILYFKVEDLSKAHRELSGRGVRFDTEPTLIADMGDHELWMTFFKDSEENQMALMSEVAKSP